MKTQFVSCLAACGTSLLLAACATPEPVTDAQIAEAIPDHVRTGETRSCLSLTRIDQIDPLTDRIWLVEARDGTVYLNQASSGCSQATSAFTYLRYETPTGQLCRNQIVEVIQQGNDIPAGSCVLGEFERLAPID